MAKREIINSLQSAEMARITTRQVRPVRQCFMRLLQRGVGTPRVLRVTCVTFKRTGAPAAGGNLVGLQRFSVRRAPVSIEHGFQPLSQRGASPRLADHEPRSCVKHKLIPNPVQVPCREPTHTHTHRVFTEQNSLCIELFLKCRTFEYFLKKCYKICCFFFKSKVVCSYFEIFWNFESFQNVKNK